MWELTFLVHLQHCETNIHREAMRQKLHNAVILGFLFQYPLLNIFSSRPAPHTHTHTRFNYSHHHSLKALDTEAKISTVTLYTKALCSKSCRHCMGWGVSRITSKTDDVFNLFLKKRTCTCRYIDDMEMYTF